MKIDLILMKALEESRQLASLEKFQAGVKSCHQDLAKANPMVAKNVSQYLGRAMALILEEKHKLEVR